MILRLISVLAAFLKRPQAIVRSVAAVSVGIVDGEPLLDLAYTEDVRAGTDMSTAFDAALTRGRGRPHAS